MANTILNDKQKEKKEKEITIINTPYPHSAMFDFVQEHQPFNPILDQPLVNDNPNVSYEQNNAQRDVIDTLREYERAMGEHGLIIDRQNTSIGFYYEHDDIYSSEKDTHKERKCWMCEKQIYFRECLNAEVGKIPIPHRCNKNECDNTELLINKITKEVEKQWESNKIEIPCCNCIQILESLQKRKLRSIHFHTDNYKIYDIKRKTFRKNKSKNTSVQLIFSDYQTSIMIKQFNNLVEKKFIDIDPNALKELLGGSE